MKFVPIVLIIVFLSCKGSADKEPPQASIPDIKSTMTVSENKDISCEELLSDIVKSSNAPAIKAFGGTSVQARLESLTSEKATIKLYVLNDISEAPSAKRLVERAVGWLELHRETGRLLDITNDPDNPLVLQYDTALLQKHDIFKMCSTDVADARPGNGNAQKDDVMLAEDIRFNGKLKRFFTISEFEKVFGKPDSTQLLSQQAPCVTIFDTEAPDDQYWYKSGSRFETSKDKVAVDEFWFRDGNFMIYKNIRIDENTTMDEIQQLFPTAVSKRMGMDKEGKLWSIKLREDHEGISDGHIKLLFKNGKVYGMHWWFPC